MASLSIVLNLDQHIKRRRSLALKHGLLSPAPPRLFVRQGDGLYAADQVRQRRIDHQIFERVAMHGCDKLDSALCNRARGKRLLRSAYLVNDDHFGHMILDRFDHHLMLVFRIGHLHSTRAAYTRMRHIPVACYFVRRINDDHALFKIIGKHSRSFAQKRRLPDSGLSHQQQAFARFDYVADYVHSAVDRATDAAGEADDIADAIPHCGYAMKSSLDARAVVACEMTDAALDVLNVFARDQGVVEINGFARITSFGLAAQVKDYFDKRFDIARARERVADRRRQDYQQQVEVIGRGVLFLIRDCSQVPLRSSKIKSIYRVPVLSVL